MIGGIKERAVSNAKLPVPPTPARITGFPRAEHRSRKKSSFLKHREELNWEGDAGDVQPSSPPPSSSSAPRSSSDGDVSTQANLYDEMSERNAETVKSMTEEEREQSRQEIVERFGFDIGERLKRARAAQRRTATEGESELPSTHYSYVYSDRSSAQRSLQRIA